jgi:release factor glutamine methyltransferase
VTVLEVIQRSSEFLARKGVESPRLQIELLLAHALRMPRLQLYLQFARILKEEELCAVREMVRRRAIREPLQHIVGSTSFCGFEIKVSPDVLIPRPETELLAQKAWEFLQSVPQTNGSSITVLDFGTGSGCLAIAIAAKVPSARVYAVDASESALRIAQTNAAENKVASQIEWWHMSSLNGLPAELRFDLVVSNPPYIPSAEIASLAPEVRDYDPRPALDGGADGLDFYRMLARHAAPILRRHGRLMLEFGDSQENAVAEILRQAKWHIDSIEADMAGKPRMVIARLPES